MAAIEVQVSGGGSITADGAVRADAGTRAACTLCGRQVEAAAELAAGTWACAACLRDRLDALSVARFRLSAGRGSLPWGKVSG